MLIRVAFCLVGLPALLAGQFFTAGPPGTFVDISLTGGTAISAAALESEHLITTTIGNALMPAGTLMVSSDGVVLTGALSGDVSPLNANFGFSGLPAGLPAGTTAALLLFWDDLHPVNPNSTIYWQEANGVLYIMWKDIARFSYSGTITFEAQIFAPTSCGGASVIKYLYPDTFFGATANAVNYGTSATIGYAHSVAAGFSSAPFSHNVPALNGTQVLTLTHTAPFTGFVANVTSPSGPGSLQIQIADCGGPSVAYFLPVTLSQGMYPNGWCYGLDISVPQLLGLWNSGAPFVGPLPATIGPFTGLPSGMPIWLVAMGLNGAYNPTGKYSRWAYVIP